jgi:hypothetical protein
MIQGRGGGGWVVAESGKEEVRALKKMQARDESFEGENVLRYL